jgi:AraC family transcriptional regulator
MEARLSAESVGYASAGLSKALAAIRLTRAATRPRRRGELAMSIQLVDRPSLTVIGIHLRTRPMSPEIKALWPRFVDRIGEIEGQTEPRVSYGVMWHEDGSMEVLHYMATVAAASPARVPPGMDSRIVPAGTYAAFSYPLAKLAQGFGEIFDRLLPSSGYLQTAGPYLERYDESFDPANPDSAVGIFIPVRRRVAQVTP